MQILKLLLILLLLFFPFGELIRFTVGTNIILKPIDILAGILLLWTIFLYIKNKKFRLSLKPYYFYFPLVGLISLLINSYWLNTFELFASFLYLFRWISYMSIFFAMQQVDQKFRNKIILFLFIDGFIVVLIGFLQYFFYQSLVNLIYLGWDNHLYRLFSSFLDPNFVGAFFVLYLILVAGTIFTVHGEKKKTLFIKSLLIISTLIAVFLTYSRSGLLMLITSGITFFVQLQKKKFIIYLFFFIGVFIVFASPFFYLENINLFRSYESFERLADFKKGLTIFKD